MTLRTRYSLWNLLAAARRGHADWAPAWREAEPKPAYDVVVVGGGGHGLATAYYLAKNHGITNVAVVEAGGLHGWRPCTQCLPRQARPGALPHHLAWRRRLGHTGRTQRPDQVIARAGQAPQRDH